MSFFIVLFVPRIDRAATASYCGLLANAHRCWAATDYGGAVPTNVYAVALVSIFTLGIASLGATTNLWSVRCAQLRSD
jgi:hypothetical protein